VALPAAAGKLTHEKRVLLAEILRLAGWPRDNDRIMDGGGQAKAKEGTA